jgi:hypothetical protein
MRRHSTWTIALGLAALCGAACTRDGSSDRAADRSADSAVVATSASVAPIVARDAGLRFDPPSTWARQRYRVESASGSAAADWQPLAAHAVAIHYQPEESRHRESSLCRFLVFTRDAWARLEGESGPPVGTVVETLDAWTFVAQLPQSNPYPAESLDATQFDAMRLSIRDVRARFSVEGGGPAAATASGEL